MLGKVGQALYTGINIWFLSPIPTIKLHSIQGKPENILFSTALKKMQPQY
jgi:hypothetical protein